MPLLAILTGTVWWRLTGESCNSRFLSPGVHIRGPLYTYGFAAEITFAVSLGSDLSRQPPLMNDEQRLAEVRNRLENLEGLDEERFQRITAELTRIPNRHGYDDQGRLKIAFFDAQSYDIESFDRQNGDRYAIRYVRQALGPNTVYAADGFRVVCVFVNDTCDAEVVHRLADLHVELIALRCAGFNNVDLNACRERGVQVVRVPFYSPYAVAEHTVALIMMLNRKLHQAYMRNRAGSFVLEGLTGFDMRGKTAGVVGTGQIGQAVVQILNGFGCRVLAFDKFPNEVFAREHEVDYVDMDRLWSESDIITLHVPLFPETHHLVNAAAIDRMKPGVMLINTSRGGLVDTRALIQGLKSGHVGAAGLDVYEEEAGIFFRDMSDKVLTDDVLARLLTFNNVVVTSHQAFLTHEALTNISETTLDNIAQFEAGKRGGDLVNSVAAPTG
jgi:D-lactate dehydrogenase